MGPIGIFGGTFDPIHYGHLRTALELAEALSLAEVRFIPCAQQPLREVTTAPAETRLRMVRAAIQGEGRFSVDTRELERPGPSYSVDTLTELRAEHPDVPLCMLLGMDSFLSLPQWHRWEAMFGLAHLVVVHRPGWQAPAEGVLGGLVVERATEHRGDLHESLCGRLFIMPVTQLEISASEVRELISGGLDPKYLIPDSVREIIIETKCYAG